MKRKELANHIEGSYLKEQYLEAFLAQSAYIEGILKLLADYTFFHKVVRPISPKKRDVTYIKAVNKKIEGQSMYDLINFLNLTATISDDLKKSLHSYREKRNKVLHDLFQEMSKIAFEKELSATCELGRTIMADKEFQKAEKILDRLDAMREITGTPTTTSSSNSAV